MPARIVLYQEYVSPIHRKSIRDEMSYTKIANDYIALGMEYEKIKGEDKLSGLSETQIKQIIKLVKDELNEKNPRNRKMTQK